MKLGDKARVAATAVCLLVAVTFVCATSVFAADSAVPSSVDVYWQSTRTIAAPGVTTVVVLDDQVAHAEVSVDAIEFAGLSRGETVALAYVNGAPVSIVVHVIERPTAAISPSLLRRQAEMAHGTIGSDFQTTSGSNSRLLALNSLSWSQQVGDHGLSFNSLVEENNQLGGHTTNLRTGSLNYHTPHLSVNAIDFNQSLSGALPEDRINNFSAANIVELRGAGVTLDYGKNEYSLFAGTTIPYYFLSLNATRDVAGLSFHRKQNDRLDLFGGTEYVNIPLSLTGTVQRRDYVMQNAGLSYRIGKGFQIGTQGGISNGGKLIRGDAAYTSYRFSGYATAVQASQTFPMNQLQSLFAGNSDFKGGSSLKITSRLTQSMYFEHTNITPGLIFTAPGSSDYVSPSLGVLLSRGETLGLTYVYSRNTGGFTTGTTTGGRYDVSLNSRLGQVTNTAQVTVGSIQDPLQISSEDQFAARDTISIPIKGQSLLLGVEHDRVNPSLLAKLNQEIGLLSPALQAEFQANPAAFIDSANFPPEVKALLAAEQPIGTTVSASTNLSLGSRLRFSPNASVTHSTTGQFANNWSETFGYSLNFQFRPTLQFRSSLSNVLIWDAQRNTTQRTMLLSFGFQKMFATAPGVFGLAHRTRIIEGRVFRDTNINGVYNVGEPGLQGVQVRLEDGEVALTDEQGRYKFPSVSADEHEVSIALTQFQHPVRMTTRSEAPADLIQQRIAVLNFGILDFARVMGNVFNDLRFENQRQPDSKGMPSIDLLLDDGQRVRKLQTSGSGDFEVDDVPPGDYKLALDTTSLPANYVAPVDSLPIHVSPVSTVVQDFPLRALRSISGSVLLKANNSADTGGKNTAGKMKSGPGDTNQESSLAPIAGVEIIAGPATAVTDAQGRFLLRNLPAGDLKVTIRPVRPVPQEINIPSGAVKLPAEPIQIQGATIVITNKDLLPYLTREFPGMPRTSPAETTAATKIHEPAVEKKPAIVHPAPTVAQPTTEARTVTRSPAAPANAPAVALNPAAPPEPRAAANPSSASSVTSTKAVPTNNMAINPLPQDGSSIVWTLTRADCEKLPSLGEVAQCFRQLKQATASQK